MADIAENAKDPNPKEVEPFLEEEADVPKDKGNLVYWIVLLHGIGTLMPWNMFITIAPTYYVNYKMVEHTVGVNGTESIPTEYSASFMHWLGICSQLPNLVLNLVNIFMPVKGELTHRITISLAIVGCVVAFTDAFVFIDTNTWIHGFFILTMISIAILNGANGIYQNSIYGMASDFPFKYTNAVIIGNNLCGTFVAIVSILVAFVTQSQTLQAAGYFSVSLLTLVACFFSFFILRKQTFYKYYSDLGAANRAKDAESNGPPSWRDYLDTFKEGWVMFLNVYIVFFVTLTIFPNMMVFIPANLKGETYDYWLPANQFVNITCFLLFNVFAWIGSMLANVKQFPSPKYLWMATWSRVLLIGFFAMCNFRPETRTLAVWFPNVNIYILFAIVMSISSGYLSSLGMMYSPKVVHASKARIAGMMAAFFLIFGIVSGLFFTIFVAKVVEM